MSLLVIGSVAIVAMVLSVIAVGRTGRRVVQPPSPEQEATARTTVRWRLAGLVTGLVVALAVGAQGGLGRGLLLAAPLFGLCVLGGVVVGELRVRPPQGPVRRAELGVRRIRDYLPRRLATAVAVATGVLALTLVLTTAAGSPDDLGRAGRRLFRHCTATVAEGRGPWPGSYYTVPLAVLVAAGLLFAATAMVRIVRRPAQAGDPAVDDALRASAARSVTAAVGVLVSVPLAGVAAVAGMTLAGFDCRPGWWQVPTAALGVVVPAALVLAAWCAAVLVVPSGERRPTPISPASR